MCRENKILTSGGRLLASPQGSKNVWIDDCIYEQIKMLWDNDIEILSCCCGHSREELGGISLTVDPKYSDSEIEEITEMLKRHDTRKWTISRGETIN